MSRLHWMGRARPRQLLAAAGDGRLYYIGDTLMHRSDEAGCDLAAHTVDAEIVAEMITAGVLRRDDTGEITTAGAP
jgi:hypothetical protein